VIAVAPTNRLVDRTDADINARIVANREVRQTVDAYRIAVSPLANQVIGTISAPMPNAADAAGDLIADAQLAATQPAALGGAVMAFMNPGGVRNPSFAFAGATYPYNLTYGNAFTVQPFGNSLVTMTLTSLQPKNLLEQQFPGCQGQTAQRILQVSNRLSYSWSASGAPCAKVQDLWFTPTDVTVVPPVATGPAEQIVQAGLVLNSARNWRVTVNNFIATGGDGFTTLLGGTNLPGGAQCCWPRWPPLALTRQWRRPCRAASRTGAARSVARRLPPTRPDACNCWRKARRCCVRAMRRRRRTFSSAPRCACTRPIPNAPSCARSCRPLTACRPLEHAGSSLRRHPQLRLLVAQPTFGGNSSAATWHNGRHVLAGMGNTPRVDRPRVRLAVHRDGPGHSLRHTHPGPGAGTEHRATASE